MPRETEEDYVARVNILYARSKQPSTTGDIDRATRSRTGGLATQTTLDANLGTAARLHFEEQTGVKERPPLNKYYGTHEWWSCTRYALQT